MRIIPYLIISLSIIAGCGQGNSVSKLNSIFECDRNPSMVSFCSDDAMIWEPTLNTGHYGSLEADGTRKSGLGANRSGGTYFVYGPYVSVEQPSTISGGIGIIAWSECWDDPFQTPCWRPDETAFVVDMIARLNGNIVQIGQTRVTTGELKVMPPRPIVGFGNEGQYKELWFGTTRTELWQLIEVRIRDVHPKLGIRASKATIKAVK